jgi:alkylation response protein AidB-like acyl-CoA dehydrogenase
VQGGKPIIEHQSIAEALVDMEISIEATRALIYRAAWLVDHERPEASRFEAMAKAKAAEVAAEVAVSALDMHGANGISRTRRIEKLVRDAMTTLHIGTAGHAAKAVLGRALAKDRHVTGLGL